MINQNMDSRVTELQESVELKEKLNAFKDKLETETVTEADVDDLIQEFQTLQDAAALYKESGNEAIRNQIVYWLDCWKDTNRCSDCIPEWSKEFSERRCIRSCGIQYRRRNGIRTVQDA